MWLVQRDQADSRFGKTKVSIDLVSDSFWESSRPE